ncbi:MAG: SCO family protein [Ignavibacteriaceae bacterium]|jgi:protein SCO1/2|nr:MAG: hypothetical protein EDM69_07845 [Chlorobiota bacterium]KXK04608.1 MAG: SCO1/SenC family protein [Chlorobi bacterium OLB4]MBV6399528.1 hypothetical protein [Ignavibacteria bacterium]MCC6886628.1 SCO family protein [Ignavibacteriales bacterium]MCE7953233.1 hypothetical protein [Chlorobi bacterium CHB7]MEB2328984.1 SCO family protein [Ignavibacteriaceae bacterium]OQY76520.1 MAG: hypothetical protein B6D43_10095 [Ignavibacteriales bacterium UTCHB1]RIK50098.1 MAG: hypothetical protein DC
MFKRYILPILIFVCCNLSVSGQSSFDWREEKNIYDQIYNAQLNLSNGERTTIHELAAKKPLLVTLIFTRCTGVCNPLLNGLKQNLRDKTKSGGFSVLVLSFDPRDSLKDMQQLSRAFDLNDDPDWKFALADSIGKVNTSVGFYPVWDEAREQFDHDAFIVGVNSQGYITKKLIGMRGLEELDLMIKSIKNEFSPTYRLPTESNLFSCFNYDPKTGKNKPGTGLLFIAMPIVLSALLIIGIRFKVRKSN